MSDLKNINWVQKTREYYLDRLTRALKARQEKKCNVWSDIPKWRLFEWYTALKLGQICWGDLPKSIFSQMNLTTRQDNGIDLVSPDLKHVTQVKHYSKDTPVTQRSISTFVQWTVAILPKAEKRLVTLDETVVSNTVQTILMPRLKMEHTRYSWKQLTIDVEKWNKEEEGLEEKGHNVGNKSEGKKRKRQDAKVNVDNESSSHGKQAKVKEVTKIKTKKTVVTTKNKPDESVETKETTINIIETTTKNNGQEKILSPLRPYQEEAMKAFDEKYHQHFKVENRFDDDMMKFRLQMACGTGKSLFAIHVIKKDMDRCPDTIKLPRYLFLCPWIDLANQVAKEFTDNGLESVSIIGGGSKLDAKKSIWICVYPSIVKIKQFLDKNKEYRIRVIVIDEAHHLEQVSVKKLNTKTKEENKQKKQKQEITIGDCEHEIEDEEKTSDSEEENKQLSDKEEEENYNIDENKDDDQSRIENDEDDEELDEKETKQNEQENEEKKKWSQIIVEMKAKVCIELSATFRVRSTIDFTYPFDKAVSDGYLTDYLIHVLYMSKGERYAALCDQLIDHLAEYSPMFLYFNTQSNAKRCLEIMKSKLETKKIDKETCDIILGNDKLEKRQQILQKMENRTVSCLFLCGVFNEGLTFLPLRTICLADMRFSAINLYQILMRANRNSSSKCFARIIIPIQNDHLFDSSDNKCSNYKELSRLCNVLGSWDQSLYDEMKIRNFSRCYVLTSTKKESNVLQAELIREIIYDRFGTCIESKKLTLEEKVNEFLCLMEKHDNSKAVFKYMGDFHFSNKQNVGEFWLTAKRKRNGYKQPYSLLLTKNEVLKVDYELWIEKHDKKSNKIKLTAEKKVNELLSLMIKHNNSKTVFKYHSNIQFSNRENVGPFWQNVKIYQKCDHKPYCALIKQNKTLANDYALYVRKKTKKLSTEAKVDEFIEIVEKNENSENFMKRNCKLTFSDGSKLSVFWHNVKQKRSCDNLPYSRLLEVPIIEQEYNKKQRNQEEKVHELLDLMNKHDNSDHVFKKTSHFLFKDKSNVGTFWDTVKRGKKCTHWPHSLLMENKVLANDYNLSTNKRNANLTPEEKVNELLGLMKEHGNCKTVFRDRNKFLFSNQEKVGLFWNTVKYYRKCENWPYSQLLENKILKKDYET